MVRAKNLWDGETARFAFKGPERDKERIREVRDELEEEGIRVSESDLLRVSLDLGLDRAKDFFVRSRTRGLLR